MFLFIVMYVVVMGGVSVLLSPNSQRPFILRFLLGFFLGPIGWLICYFMKPPLSPEEAAALHEKFQREQAQLEVSDRW